MKNESRYEILDGLRGIAAIGVALFHLSVFGLHIAPHGYLAVDFFFMLSGFVLANAYEDRLSASLSFVGFLRLRLIRIMPLCTLGLLAGSSYFILRSLSQSHSLYSLQDITGSTVINLVLLPKPWMTLAPSDTLFPTNTPLWSLSLEMFVNLIWASFLFKLGQTALMAIVAASAVVLCSLVFLHGTADLGATWPTYMGGIARVVFGFFAGILIWRKRHRVSASVFQVACAILMLASVFFIPLSGPLFDIGIILIAFPLVIIVAIRSEYGWGRTLFRFVGQISFPLYVIHAPIMMTIVGLAKAFEIDGHPYILPLIAIAIAVLAAYFLDLTYDRSARRFLMRVAFRRPVAGDLLCDSSCVVKCCCPLAKEISPCKEYHNPVEGCE